MSVERATVWKSNLFLSELQGFYWLKLQIENHPIALAFFSYTQYVQAFVLALRVLRCWPTQRATSQKSRATAFSVYIKSFFISERQLITEERKGWITDEKKTNFRISEFDSDIQIIYGAVQTVFLSIWFDSPIDKLFLFSIIKTIRS